VLKIFVEPSAGSASILASNVRGTLHELHGLNTFLLFFSQLELKELIKFNAFSQVGNTPLIKLDPKFSGHGASVWLKVESGNPTGSFKDRMAISVIGNALDRGELSQNQSVVEYTGGSTGSALAFACASAGLKFTAIFSDAFSDLKRSTMETFGAEKVEELGAFYADQFGSQDVTLGYEPMGQEISKQIDGNVDLLCAAVGTGGAFMGTLNGLNKSNIYPKAVALEPLQSPFLTTGKGGSHKVEGIGVGFYPPFLDAKRINECMSIDQEKAFEMRALLASKQGVLCGTSTGLNVVGAIKLARQMSPNENVVTFGCDSGLKYLG
jgi:cysteine synthase A